jgi:hypothetical protein
VQVSGLGSEEVVEVEPSNHERASERMTRAIQGQRPGGATVSLDPPKRRGLDGIAAGQRAI